MLIDHVANSVHRVPHVTSTAAACSHSVPRANQVQLLGALVVRPTLVAEHPACSKQRTGRFAQQA